MIRMEIEMAPRNAVLIDTQSDRIGRLVASGRYQNALEALRAGLRLLKRNGREWGQLRALGRNAGHDILWHG